MNGRNCTIYGFKLKSSDEFRYIGQTIRFDERMRHHKHRAKAGEKYPLYNWIRKHKGEYEVVILDDKATFNESEIEYIRNYREKGHRLLNCNEGGDGQYGFTHSDETKKKLSEIMNGKQPFFEGQKHTDKTKKKMSESRKRRISTHGPYRHEYTDEQKINSSQAAKLKWEDPEYREKNTKNKCEAAKKGWDTRRRNQRMAS